MFDIEAVIEELKNSDPNGFIIESHLQVKFGYALKRVCKHADLTFEWTNKTGRADLIATLGNEVIAFEFKYFTKHARITLNNDLTVDLKDQAARDIPRTGVWKDVQKIEELISDKTNKITKGYCLLITNDKKVFDEPKITSSDYDFDLSNGLHPRKKELVKLTKKGAVVNENHIEGKYNLENKSYNNNGFYYLAIEIK